MKLVREMSFAIAVGVLAVPTFTQPSAAERMSAVDRVHPVSRGDLDPSFGGGGVVTTDVAGLDEVANDVAVQPDGRIVAVGNVVSGPASVVLARYDVDGTPDPTFGDDGITTTDGFVAVSVAIQEDGRIVVAGATPRTSPSEPWDETDFAVARYDVDGTLDPTFGAGGVVTTDVAGFTDAAEAVTLQPDGRIVVAGHSSGGGPSDMAVARYLGDGTPDQSFGGDGTVTVDVGGAWNDARAVAVEPDGDLVAAGRVWTIHPDGAVTIELALSRLGSDGTPDAAFGAQGTVTTAVGDTYAQANGVAVLPDGDLVVAGGAQATSGEGSFALARYDEHGNLDVTFGDDGVATTSFAGAGGTFSRRPRRAT